MIDIEELGIHDSCRWLGTGKAAAEHTKRNQSTISRTVGRVEHFSETLAKIGGEHLLQMESRIH